MQKLNNIQFDQIKPFGIINEIDLGQCNHCRRYGKQIKDGQMFTRLRHDALIRSDHEHGCVNTTHAGQHILDKINVSGDINNAYILRRSLSEVGHPSAVCPNRQIDPGKAQIDGHTTCLFFFQTVGINAGKCLNQG